MTRFVLLVYLARRKKSQQQNLPHFKFAPNLNAFTLIELLVVISIVSILTGIVIASLSAFRAQAKQIICAGNIRQLAIANSAYAAQNNGYYVPSALDIYSLRLHRWYGVRDNLDQPFDNTKGSLAPYLQSVNLKCPVKIDFTQLPTKYLRYDKGSGGYGYNMVYIGSIIWKGGYNDQNCKVTAQEISIRHPSQTLMFADTAITEKGSLIEYSCADPRYFVFNGEPEIDAGWDPSPSIHFRHRHKANIAWADGHVTSEKIAEYDGLSDDKIKPSSVDLGWFEPMDNSLFDLK